MALSLDDRLLGEKVHNYCSSSEDEAEDKEESDVSQPVTGVKGLSTNTGPKGVIEDWRRYKQLEEENREDGRKERLALAKKLQFSCRTTEEDEAERQADEEFLAEFDDEFLAEYRQKRIEEMRHALASITCFGAVLELDKSTFVSAIDDEKPSVTVIIHIYELDVLGCETMNGCLVCLANDYPTVKFCKIRAGDAKLSSRFSATGVPALLVYKGGQLIGNFVRMADELTDDFFANDVEVFLQEHGFLPGVPSSIRSKND